MVISVFWIRVNPVVYPKHCYRCHTHCTRFNASSKILFVIAEGFSLQIKYSNPTIVSRPLVDLISKKKFIFFHQVLDQVEVLRAKLLILRSFFTPYRCSKQALILLQAEEQLNNFNNLWKCFLLKTSLLPQWKWLFTLVEDKSALFMEVQKFISRNLF